MSCVLRGMFISLKVIDALAWHPYQPVHGIVINKGEAPLPLWHHKSPDLSVSLHSLF